MSWADELAPMPLTPWRLAEDLLAADRQYRAEGIPAARRAIFLLMRVSQRSAYWAGWAVSSAEALVRDPKTPDASPPCSGQHPADLVAEMVEDFERGAPVALGFEWPLWVDLPSDAEDLTRGRDGEGSRA